MLNVIKVTENNEGKVVVKLYGEEMIVPKTKFKNGSYKFSKFGNEYELQLKSAKAKKIKVDYKDEGPKFIETKID